MSIGCQWQNKSFSVPMMGSTIGYCSKCGAEIKSVVYKHNGNMLCKVCFSKVRIRKSPGLKSFLTTKDRLYNFVDVNTTGKPIQFTSKRQWQKHLKKLGLNDDVKQSRSSSEVKNSFAEKSKFRPVPREELKREILKSYDEIRRR